MDKETRIDLLKLTKENVKQALMHHKTPGHNNTLVNKLLQNSVDNLTVILEDD